MFAGGWTESTGNDTSAYNLQTPSMFIDMRFPTERPDTLLKIHRSLQTCSNFELRVLARQHCFGGYSLPESNPETDNEKLVFTRHHIIDWNFHPHFPRSRPNRWFVEVQEPSRDSFKEHSTVLDENNIPVYFERWQRRLPAHNQTTKYLAMRRKTECPLLKQARQQKQSSSSSSGGVSEEDRDAVLVVVGNHFALAVDRNYERVMQHMQQYLIGNKEHGCKGSGAAFVDYLLSADTNGSSGDADKHRQIAIDYLELEGSYGQVYEHLPPLSSNSGVVNDAGLATVRPTWLIQKSTLPWKEGGTIIAPGDVSFQFKGANTAGSQYIAKHPASSNTGAVADTVESVSSVRWTVPNSAANGERGSNNYCSGEWEVLECSFSREELADMFHLPPQFSSAVRSRL